MIIARIEQTRPMKAIMKRVLTAHQYVYERSNGRLGHKLLGVPVLLLRTTGKKSGLARANCLIYGRDGEDYIVVASASGAPRAPGWYHNLRAEPRAEIQIGTHAVPTVARAILPGEPAYERLWHLMNSVNLDRYKAYQQATERPIPLVALTPQV